MGCWPTSWLTAESILPYIALLYLLYPHHLLMGCLGSHPSPRLFVRQDKYLPQQPSWVSFD